MKGLFTTTAIGAMLAVAPALAQEPPQPGDTPEMQQEQQQQQQQQPEPAQPTEPPAATEPTPPDTPDVAEPTDPDAPDVAEPAEPEADAPDVAEGPAELDFMTSQGQDEYLAQNLIGQSVVNAQEESIGQINDLVFNEDGELTGALIGVGGFLGIGQKVVGVNFEALEIARDMDDRIQVSLDATTEELEAAPDFQTLEEARRNAEAGAPPAGQEPGAQPPASQ